MASIGQNIIKHEIRYDLEMIANLVESKAKVLDIGCGDGELLNFLKAKKNIDGRGIEISQELVGKALKQGLSVIQGDAENDLSFYPNQKFDYAILSQTLQATRDPKKMLQEMLRIAKFAIVSVPNFAHYKTRWHLMIKGTMPVNKTIPFEWYETPNIHFCSIHDFKNLCSKLDFSIEKEVFLTAKRKLNGVFGNKHIANFMAEYAIFLVSQNCHP